VKFVTKLYINTLSESTILVKRAQDINLQFWLFSQNVIKTELRVYIQSQLSFFLFNG